MIYAAYTLWLMIGLAIWRRWLGGWKWYDHPTPGSRLTKWTVFAVLLWPLYVAWGWWGVPAALLVSLWFSVRHENFGAGQGGDYAVARYFPVGWAIRWLLRNEDRLPVRYVGGHRLVGGATEWGELLIGAWAGLLLGAAITLEAAL